MLLSEFLSNRSLESVETLPDDRLINVIVDGNQLYGIIINDVPDNTLVTRRHPVTYENDIIAVDGLTFDTTQYTIMIQGLPDS